MPGHGLICVAGIIGVGKTTLARALASRLDAHLLEEPYDRNPYIEDQYAGRVEAALSSQLFFLKSRAAQLHRDQIARHDTVISDYIYQKDRIFARLHLDDRQFACYEQRAQAVDPIIARPHRVIYLTDTVENCLQRITLRGRKFEKTITAEFLSRLHDAYAELMQNWQCCPLTHIDCARHDTRDFDILQGLMSEITGKPIGCTT